MHPLLAGAACRCPACGRGRLYSGFLRVARGCPCCGRSFDRMKGESAPAALLVLAVGVLCGLGALATTLAGHQPLAPALAVWLPIGALLSLALLRPFKGLWIALRLRTRSSEAARAGR